MLHTGVPTPMQITRQTFFKALAATAIALVVKPDGHQTKNPALDAGDVFKTFLNTYNICLDTFYAEQA